jgi:transcriptional regulator with XRE-family HTH domain
MSFALSTTKEILGVFGRRIRTQRLSQGLSQSDLASMAGLSLGAVRTLESRGRSSLETFIKVTKSLGLIGELEDIFKQKRQSIALMEQMDATKNRQRAPRKKHD